MNGRLVLRHGLRRVSDRNSARPSTSAISCVRSHALSSSAVRRQEEPPAPQKNAAPVLKRFWKRAGVKEEPNGSLTIMLDHRVLKTADGVPLTMPRSKRLLASLIANEWESQDKVIKHHALPLTSLACKALDSFEDSGARYDAAVDLLRYLNTDTIRYQEDHPSALVDLQKEHWDPLFEWVRAEYGVELELADGFLPNPVPDETVQKFLDILLKMDKWELAGMERAVYFAKSFVIALALVRGRLTAEKAAEAASVEVQSQIKRWGEVEDTHDVDHRDLRRQLASAALTIGHSSPS